MRFIHTSDLHIGKVVNGFSMLEEQRHALGQILRAVREHRADAVFLSGDLYDRSIPPAAAVTVLDEFLTRLSDLGVKVYAIAGNHDCKERIGFASRILDRSGVYLEGTLSKDVRYADMETENGLVRIHMIPYGKPAEIRALYGVEVANYEEAMRELLNHVNYLEGGGNILITHQFVVNEGREPELSDSETRVCVGGADQVEAANFYRFDYVALGHIHGPQQIGGLPAHYSGSPIKYSFSEVSHKKSVVLGVYEGPGRVSVTRLPLTPIHDMRRIRGRLADLTREDVVEAEGTDQEDYILAVLTDEEELIDPIGTLRSVYPNVMQLQIERKSERQQEELVFAQNLKEKTPVQLFEDFYGEVTGKELDEERRLVVKAAAEKAGEESR